MISEIRKAIEPEIIARASATIRMFVAAHNTERPGDGTTAEELELLEDAANALERFLRGYKAYMELIEEGRGSNVAGRKGNNHRLGRSHKESEDLDE